MASCYCHHCSDQSEAITDQSEASIVLLLWDLLDIAISVGSSVAEMRPTGNYSIWSGPIIPWRDMWSSLVITSIIRCLGPGVRQTDHVTNRPLLLTILTSMSPNSQSSPNLSPKNPVKSENPPNNKKWAKARSKNFTLSIESLVCYLTDPKIGSMFILKVVDIKQRVTCDD